MRVEFSEDTFDLGSQSGICMAVHLDSGRIRNCVRVRKPLDEITEDDRKEALATLMEWASEELRSD